MAASPARDSLGEGEGTAVRRSTGITTSSQTAAALSSHTRWRAAWAGTSAAPSSPGPGPSGSCAGTGGSTRRLSRTSRGVGEKVTIGDKCPVEQKITT